MSKLLSAPAENAPLCRFRAPDHGGTASECLTVWILGVFCCISLRCKVFAIALERHFLLWLLMACGNSDDSGPRRAGDFENRYGIPYYTFLHRPLHGMLIHAVEEHFRGLAAALCGLVIVLVQTLLSG